MKKSQNLFLLTVCIFFPSLAFPLTSNQAPKTGKKGLGLSEKKGFNDRHLKALKVHWYYNWAGDSEVNSSIEFVPMIFSKKGTDIEIKSAVILGFNEPDNSKQLNM